MNRRTLALTGLAVLGILLAWVVSVSNRGGVRANGPEPPQGMEASASTGRTAVDGGGRGSTMRLPGRRTSHAAQATLEIMVHSSIGPASCESWRADSLADLWRATSAREERSEIHIAPGVAATMGVERGSWSLLRVECSGQVRTRFVAPFDGTHSEVFEFGDQLGGIHVLVLRSDYRTPAPGRLVELIAASGIAGTTGESRAGETDVSGIVTFDAVGPGAWTVALGRGPGFERPPSATRVIMLPGMPGREAVCLLVEPESTFELHLHVFSDGSETGATTPQLYLRRFARGPALLLPIPPLRPGGQSHVLRVPSGDYRIDGLPQGWLRVRPDILSVPDGVGSEVALHTRENPEVVHLRLEGIAAADLPLQVRFEPNGAVIPATPGLLYLGPYRWRRLAEAVPACRGAGRVVATGRRCFVSRGVVELSPASVVAQMEVARRVHVEWVGWEERDAMGSLVVLDDSRHAILHALTPTIARGEVLPQPTMQTEVVAPQHDCRIACLDPDGGVRWERRLMAGGENLTVRVDEVR